LLTVIREYRRGLFDETAGRHRLIEIGVSHLRAADVRDAIHDVRTPTHEIFRLAQYCLPASLYPDDEPPPGVIPLVAPRPQPAGGNPLVALAASLPLFDWSRPDVCEFFRSAAAAMRQMNPECRLAEGYSFRDAQCAPIRPDWSQALRWNYDNRLMGAGNVDFGGILTDFLRGTLDFYDLLANVFLPATRCDVRLTTVATVTRLALQTVERWVTGPIPHITEPIQHTLNYACPWQLPTAGDAASAYTYGQIDLSTAECWAKANGMLPGPWHAMVRTAQRIPST
jgi:hypothetical protein